MCDWIVLLLLLCCKPLFQFELPNSSSSGYQHCGIDYSPADTVYEGFATVETYPWLGRLYYPHGDKKWTTTVVLVTKELVIAAALDIDKFPKTDFRAKSRVALGHNCSGPLIKIRDYSFHPDYKDISYSALAIIQLENINLGYELHPICNPPTSILETEFYAMTLTKNCDASTMKIYKMMYVDPEECKIYYRKSGLDTENMWPTHTACARARSGGKCVWRNGAVLVLREGRKWRLVGFGVYGPGCGNPSRFLDYGMYHAWVETSIRRMGRPAVTRIGIDELIVRKKTASLQRFGLCDKEETKAEIFTERAELNPGTPFLDSRVVYNLTLFTNVDYSCVVIKVTGFSDITDPPRINLRRWCTSPQPICYELQNLQIDLYVEISFKGKIVYKVLAYGSEVRLVDRKAFQKYFNSKTYHPVLFRSPEDWRVGDKMNRSLT